MSKFTRKLLGLIGLLLLFMILVEIYHGSFSLPGGRYGWLMPLMPIAFIAYAIGGQRLLGKYLPFFAEKDKTTNTDEKGKN